VTRGPWQVRYTRQGEKDLAGWTRRSDGASRPRSIALLRGIPSGVTRLRGTNADYPLRVGDWRVIFRRLDDELLILVVRVLPRGRAYER
jgi:mRNA interferase RelE/StbE